MKIISSQDNQFIKLASSLKHKKYRDAQGLFLVEGRRAVAEALDKPELVQAVFQEQGMAEDSSDCSRAEGWADCFMIEPRLMKYICNTEEPQGIAALVKKPVWSWEAVVNQRGMLVLLDRISDPGNLGSILRTCWAFDVGGVLLSPGCVDPFNPKVVRSTMGAILDVPVFSDVSAEQCNNLERAGYQFMSTDIGGGDVYSAVKYRLPLVIIFGSEAWGVSEDLKKRCKIFTYIPMNPQVDSLNVAAACAIIVAEARRQFQAGAEMTDL
ncbi:MAG: RNA methyltransferase [Syntrophomonadaceae bacterium]|nr:RNA methyltransferase [Syntrophomonadaceae bacterium]